MWNLVSRTPDYINTVAHLLPLPRR